MLDAFLYLLIAIMLLFTARWLLIMLFRTIVNLMSLLVQFSGTIVVVGLIVWIVVRILL